MTPVKLFCRCNPDMASRLNGIAPASMTEDMQRWRSSNPISYFFVSDIKEVTDDVPLAGPVTSNSIMEEEFLNPSNGWEEITEEEMMEILYEL